MNFKSIKDVILYVLFIVFFICFLVMAGTVDAIQIIWHDVGHYFNSIEKVGHFFGIVGLLATFGFFFYCIGFSKGVEKGREFQQDPSKFKKIFNSRDVGGF
jgi:hypothetical protein